MLQALWTRPDGLTAHGVSELLPGRHLARTTVLTTLDRLRRKHLVTREDSTRPHTYFAAVSQEDYVAEIMLDALGQATDRDAVLTRFLGGVGEDDARSLRRILHRR